MANVPGLRSPYVKTGRLVYFGRMLDKIRLQLSNALPADYQANYGDTSFNVADARCCRFLGVRHSDIAEQVKRGKTDEETLAWCEKTGGHRTDEQCDVWNNFMMKRGWRDEATERLKARIAEAGLSANALASFFDLIDADEGRDPAKYRPF